MSTTPTEQERPDLFQQWLRTCTPVQVYSVIALLNIILLVYMKQYNTIPLNAVTAIILIFAMDSICKKGYVWVSWILIFLPTVLTVLYTLFFKGGNMSNIKY